MLDFSKATLEALLSSEGHDCACGKRHKVGLTALKSGAGAIEALPEALRDADIARPFVVCDANTYEAAGRRVEKKLRAAGIPYGLFVFPEQKEKLEPDEAAVGAVAMAFDPRSDAVLAVGSGVINDCAKVMARAACVPSAVVATAPSMDGYASNSSSMIQNRVKVTLYNACPTAIIADTDILRAAPLKMLRAGLGDMLAKYVAICEWRISRIVTGDYYCENVAGLMRRAVRRCVKAGDGLMRRDPAAVEAVTEGLVLSGVAMAFAEVSRPASGLEHYFSHLWEMMALERGEASELHGVQVGVGTALTLAIYDRLRGFAPDRAGIEARHRAFSQDAWEGRMRGIFGKIAPTVIEMEKTRYHKNDPASHAQRLDRILAHWREIQAIIGDELPETEAILSLMRRLGMAMTSADIGISAEDTKNALLGSREIRDKYITSSLLWDLGELDAFADGYI